VRLSPLFAESLRPRSHSHDIGRGLPSSEHETSGHLHQPTNSDWIGISVTDNGPLILTTASKPLSSFSWRIEPFIDPDTILNYAAGHHPAAAIINFGGSGVYRLDIARRLRAISPSTSVKVHRRKAHKMLIGTEMVNLIKQRCVEIAKQLAFDRVSQAKEIDFEYCV
jgi:hypothetical protein